MKNLIETSIAIVIYVICVFLCIMLGVMLGSAIGGDPSPGVAIGGILGVIGGILLGRKAVGLVLDREEEELKIRQKENKTHNINTQTYHNLEEQTKLERVTINTKKEEKLETHALRLQTEINELLSTGKIIIPGYLSFNLMEEGLTIADIQASPNEMYVTTRYFCPDGSVFGVIQDKSKVVMVKECYPNCDNSDEIKILKYVLENKL